MLFFKWRTINILIRGQQSYSQVKPKVRELKLELELKQSVSRVSKRNILLLTAERFDSLKIASCELLDKSLDILECVDSTLFSLQNAVFQEASVACRQNCTFMTLRDIR